MMYEVIGFYFIAIMTVMSTIGIVFLPRMIYALFSFFFLILLFSLLLCFLNAKYVALFGFLLLGVCLVGYIFLLLKKIGRLNLSLKLVSNPKMFFSGVLVVLFGLLVLSFFFSEIRCSMFQVFNITKETSFDQIGFLKNMFPLHLSLLLLLVAAAVVRVLLLADQSVIVVKNEEPENISQCDGGIDV